MKKIIVLTILFGTVLTFLIYKFTYHEPLHMLVLGDGIATGNTAYNVDGYSFNSYLRDYFEDINKIEEYITEFSNNEETSQTLKTKITSNYTLESTHLSIQQALSKSKTVTIALGMKELNEKKKIKSKDIDIYLENMDQILKLITIYNKKNIYLISLYETKKLSKERVIEINQKLNQLCEKYKVTFIDISDIIHHEDFFFKPDSFYPNYKGHHWISQIIINHLNSI